MKLVDFFFCGVYGLYDLTSMLIRITDYKISSAYSNFNKRASRILPLLPTPKIANVLLFKMTVRLLPTIDILPLNYGHWITPCAQRQPPQVGKVFAKQSSSFSSERSQPPQMVQGEKSNAWTRWRKLTYSGCNQSESSLCSLKFPTTYRREVRLRRLSR